MSTDVDGVCEEFEGCKLHVEKKISDKELFKHPPSLFGDCPICFLEMPTHRTGMKYKACCGKIICSGCIYAPVYDDQGNKVDKHKCPFCRIPTPTSDKEINDMLIKRVEAGDPIAIYNRGNYFRDGRNGFPQDCTKALELYHRAAQLGYAPAYLNIGYAYDVGEGVEVDKEKARHYYELAAIGGNEVARNNLGTWEKREGNIDRALKHYMIAVRSGHDDSLKRIKHMYTDGQATKDEYTKALRSYQEYLDEIKSSQRDKAAAASERFRYY